MPLVRRMIERAAKVGGAHPSGASASALFSSMSTLTGRAAEIAMNPETALQSSAVYSCQSLIAESVGGLPVELIEKIANMRKERDDHPYYTLLADTPNPELDAAELWRQTTGWMLSRGNGYIYQEHDEQGQVRALWPVPANRVMPARSPKGQLIYVVRLGPLDYAGPDIPSGGGGVDVALFPWELMHFRAYTLGLVGISPIVNAALTVALGHNAEEYAAMFFEQGSKPGGLISVPKTLTDTEWDTMRARWEKLHSGAKRSHMVAILEGGAKWEDAGVTNAEMQFLELRNFQVEEIARVYRVPPHMIASVSKTTSWGSGIEQQNIAFVTFTLLPWITRIERVVRMRMFSQPRDKGLNLRLNTSGYLRGDMQARYLTYQAGRQWGWLTVNDIRRLEDMNPLPGDAGNVTLMPLNMAPVGEDGQPMIDESSMAARAGIARMLGDLGALKVPDVQPPAELVGAHE